jgi:diaminopimelate decarboxylase
MAISRNPDGKLTAGGVRIEDLPGMVEGLNTPFFVYDLDEIENRMEKVRNAFPGTLLLYAVKANPNPALLGWIGDRADGFDLSSKGEIEAITKNNIKADLLSFSGPGKTDKDLELATLSGKVTISIESLRELERISAIAKANDATVDITLRVNPRMTPPGFQMKMGGRPSPFGIDEENIAEAGLRLKKEGSLNFMGIHVFSGTQCLDAESVIQDIEHTMDIARAFEQHTGLQCRLMNFGGGFGIPYFEGDTELDIDSAGREFGKLFKELNRNRKTPVIPVFELGRYLVGTSGLYITRVIDRKTSRDKEFLVMDGGMHHHLAASGNLGQVIRRNFRMEAAGSDLREMKCHVVGPLCTPLDVLGSDIMLPSGTKEGDLLAVFNSGAYTHTASPVLFLSRERPVELLVKGGRVVSE